MQIHQLKSKTPRKKAQKVGRGGRRGKTSGRGHKGQKARAGSSPKPEARALIKAFPKLRGATAIVRVKETTPVNLLAIEKHFEIGETVSVFSLMEKGLIKGKRKKNPVKILGFGQLTKKIIIDGCEVSTGAREKIEQAGGQIV